MKETTILLEYETCKDLKSLGLNSPGLYVYNVETSWNILIEPFVSDVTIGDNYINIPTISDVLEFFKNTLNFDVKGLYNETDHSIDYTFYQNNKIVNKIVKNIDTTTTISDFIKILIDLCVKYNFLKPDNMKKLGFDCLEDKHPYYKYGNNATVHYNIDYNSQFPEPKCKVLINCNIDHVTSNKGIIPYMEILQDGGSRKVYNGLCPSKEFLLELLNNNR